MTNPKAISPKIERRPNAPVPGEPLKFLTQIAPKNQEALFSMELPAQVQCSGGAFGGGVTPVGRIVLDGHPSSAACVSAAVLDESSLTRAATRLEAQVGEGILTAAAIRLESGTKSFAEIVGLAAHAGCGCGGASIEGALRLGASISEDCKLIWSDPIPAMLNVKSGNDGIETELFAATSAFIVVSCNSDWYWKGFFGSRFTLCEGECKGADSGKACRCSSGAGANTRLCQGWVGCDC